MKADRSQNTCLMGVRGKHIICREAKALSPKPARSDRKLIKCSSVAKKTKFRAE